MFDPPSECARKGALGELIQMPVVEYANWAVTRAQAKVDVEPLGSASVGGFIYRGKAIPRLYGKLVLGDFSITLAKPSGQLLLASPSATWREPWPLQRLLTIEARIHSLGEDADGELYVLSTAYGIPVGRSGKLWKLVQAKR